MTQGQEQQQLLADASALLMFASAAARQNLPSQNSTSNAPNIARSIDNSHISRQGTPKGAGETSSEQTMGSANPTEPKTGTFTAHYQASNMPSGFVNQSFSGVSSGPLPPPHRPSHGSLPQLKPLAMASHSSGLIDARILASGGYNYPQQIAPNIRPLEHRNLQPPPAHRLPFSSYSAHGTDALQGATAGGGPSALPRILSQGYPAHNADRVNVPLRRQSLAQSPAEAGKNSPKQDPRRTQSESPLDPLQERGSVPKLRALSPKPVSSENPPTHFDPHVLSRDFPAKGNFEAGPKRAPSEPGSKRPSIVSPAGLPGLNGVAFARGINVESGKRSTDNAIIAAAALAVAADIPFPLKNKEDQMGLHVVNNSTVAMSIDSNNMQNRPNPGAMSPPFHQTSGSFSATSGIGGIGKLESTETEDDENKTEDEPVLSARESLDTPEVPPAKIGVKEEVPAGTSAALEPEQPILESTEATKLGTLAFTAQPPPLDSYKVDPDAGIIGCICAIDEDDGFTIQCDLCYRWQHCSCMGYLTNEEVPEDEYKCYYCDEQKWNKFDPEQCRAATLARLEMDKANDVPEKPAAPKRKTLSSGNDEKKRRKSEKDTKPPLEKNPSEKRKSSSASSPNSKPVHSTATALIEIHNKENPLLEDGATAEPYQGVYYKLTENDYKTPEVKNLIVEIGVLSEKALKATKLFETMSLHQYKQTKFSKISLPNHQKYLQDRNELRRCRGFNKTTIKVKAYSENPKQKFVSVSKVGLFITDKSALDTVIAAGTPVIEYLGEVDSFKLYVENTANQYPIWGTVKPRVAKIQLPGTKNENTEVVIDARFVGNEARFIRRSCVTTANCEIRPVYIPQLQTFKFLVVTTQPINLKGEKLEEELRLPWEWDVAHPINQMISLNAGNYEEGRKFEEYSDEDKTYLISCVDTILNFVECACNTSAINNQCSIFKVKKATSYLLRSNRKASSLGGGSINIAKTKDELVMPKKAKEYLSWKQRLIDRDCILLEQSEYATAHLPVDKEESVEQPDAQKADNSNGNQEKSSPKDTEEKLVETRQFKATFRQELFAQNKQFSITKYEVSHEKPKAFDATTIPLDLPQKVLAIPLTSEVLARIKKQVNETFMPLQKDAPNVDVTAEVTEVVPEVKAKEAVAERGNLPSPVAETPITEAVSSEKKPPVVKKFSFADYKKKMK